MTDQLDAQLARISALLTANPDLLDAVEEALSEWGVWQQVLPQAGEASKLNSRSTDAEGGPQADGGASPSKPSFVPRLRAEVSNATNAKQEQPRPAAEAAVSVPKGTQDRKAYTDLEELLDSVRRDEVRLLDGRFLVSWHEEGKGPIRRCQDMPSEAFLNAQTLDASNLYPIALSYCWAAKEHPDPHGFHLDLVVQLLKMLLAGDPHEIDKPHFEYRKQAGFVSGLKPDCLIGIFWDFASLPQAPRSEDDKALFKGALKRINAWYGNENVTTWILPDLPAASYEIRSGYDASGWTKFEREVSNILTPPGRMLRWDEGGQWKDKESYLFACFAAASACTRSGPMEPAAFNEVVGTLRFTNQADIEDVVKPKYSESFAAVVSGATSISFINYRMSATSLRRALQLLRVHCHQTLKQLDLNRAIEDGKPASIEDVLADFLISPSTAAGGSAAKKQEDGSRQLRLEHLSLAYCTSLTGKIDVFAPLVTLKHLNLVSCSCLEGNISALAHLKHLQTLKLWDCYCLEGDVAELAPLMQLQYLDLCNCRSLVGALSGLAALVQLQSLDLKYCAGLEGDVAELAPLVNLTYLDVDGCKKITGDKEALYKDVEDRAERQEAN